ncbi:MAG: 3-oxoacyl-ACP reductase family protein [Dehalococcoidia bacterium]|jgi:NAD(P)-dependent dehydrogenase (short-subunit alcohol dehydrogenase family)
MKFILDKNPQMDFLGLERKTAIVTGGGSNIGRGIVIAFAKQGANVAIAELDEAQGAKVAKEASATGRGKVENMRTDVTDWESVQAMVKKTLDKFGQLDILVNAVGWVRDDLFIRKSREDWEKEIARNLWSDINCTRAVLDHMIERNYGKIISIGSDAARVGQLREAVYSGCKGALISMTKSLARELGRYGINVNIVCPGVVIPESRDATTSESMWTDDMMKIFSTPEALDKIAKGIPLGRLGTPDDIANAVLFLSSDRANFITGQTISVDGGYTMA